METEVLQRVQRSIDKVRMGCTAWSETDMLSRYEVVEVDAGVVKHRGGRKGGGLKQDVFNRTNNKSTILRKNKHMCILMKSHKKECLKQQQKK